MGVWVEMQEYLICDGILKIHDPAMFQLPSPSGGDIEPFVHQDCADWKHGADACDRCQKGGG